MKFVGLNAIWTLILVSSGLASLIGLIVHSIYTVKRGPIHLVNQFVGVWLAALTLIQSAQLFFTIRSSLASEKRWVRAVEFCYFLLFLIGSVVLLIGFGLALRGDGIGWSATLVLVNCANIVAFWLKRPGEFDQLASAPKPYTLSCLSWFLRFFLLIFLILLCNGSLLLGIGTVLYQPRGSIIEVPLFDGSGRHQKIHFYCEGPKNNSIPVIFIETDGSHGMADSYGLQMMLVTKGLRTCIWDKPGLGHSENMFADQLDYRSIYHSFFLNTAEQPPFLLIGQGGGGDLIYQYAIEHPEMVQTLVYLDVYPFDYEWKVQQYLKNLSDDAIAEVKSSALSHRLCLAQLIKGLACPWGILPAILPSNGKYFPPERYNEFHWFMLTDKTWTTQYYFMQQFWTAKDSFVTRLPANISLIQIMSKLNDSQVIRQSCVGMDVDSPECQYQLDSNRFSIAARQNLTEKLAYDASIYYCTEDDCGLAYLLYGNPKFTADIVGGLFGR